MTTIKIVGLFAIIAFAFLSNNDAAKLTAPATPAAEKMSWGVGLILVLFTYGGWNEMVYVASEVRDPKRNLSRGLLMGSVAVTLMYLLTNAAYLWSLGLDGMASSDAIATDAVAAVLPRWGQVLVAAVITVSAAGSINGLVLTGARITGAMRGFAAFRWIGYTNPNLQTPVRALVLEGVISIIVIMIAQSFENALIYTAAAVYTFYLATGFSTVILRVKDPNAERQYRMPLYPLPLVVFAAACVFTIYSALTYKPWAAAACLLILATGALAYRLQKQ